ncbi:MAG: heme-copper oxidase subunit III [Candidatus Acidiferrales bacterium]
MSTIPFSAESNGQPWVLPYRGTIGIYCLIAAESAMFSIFVIAYIYYMGKSLSGPTPRQVLELPIFTTVCLLSSSITVHQAVKGLRHEKWIAFKAWLATTVLLGSIFMIGTGLEWHTLIYKDGFTLQTNLFGTSFYSLVGLHASHVTIGLLMLGITLILALMGKVKREHADRFHALSLYWHFVDAVWVVVFTIVYILGR